MADPKQIKFQFTVDEASAQKARQLIRELTSDLSKLAEAASKGGGVFGGSGAVGMKVGAGNVGGQGNNAQVIAKTAPAGRGIVQGLLDQRQIFKGIADGSKDSMRMTTDALHAAVGSQKKDLKELEDAAARVTARYDALNKTVAAMNAAGQNAGPAAAEKRDSLLAEHVQLTRDRDRASKNLDVLQNMGERAGVFPGKHGTKSFGGYLDTGDVDTDSMNGMSVLTKQRALKDMSPMLKSGLVIGAAVIAGITAAAKETLAAPQRFNNAQAERAGMWMPMMNEARSGDISRTVALMNMDQSQRDDLGTASTSRMATRWSQGIGGIGSVFSGNAGVVGDTIHGQSDANIEGKMMGNVLEQSDAAMRADARQTIISQKFSQEAGARAQMMRSLGMGYAVRDRKGNKLLDRELNGPQGMGGLNMPGHGVRRNGMDDFLYEGTGQGAYDNGELFSAFQGVRGSGGQRAAGAMASFAMRAQASGMGNAADVAGRSFIGGSGADFMRTLYGGNVDVGARSILGGVGASQFGDGGAMTGGLGFMGGAMATGFGQGKDMLAAQQIQGGVAGMGNLLGGKIDAYQGGRNLVAAVDALGPGASTYAQDFLSSKMTPRMAMDILQSGKVPLELSDRGVTLEAVEKWFKSTQGSTLDRYVAGGGSDKQTTMARAMKESGSDPRAFFKEQTAGLSGKALANKQEEMVRVYGGMLSDTTGVSTQDGMGEARLLFGAGATGRKGGPGNAAKDSAEEANRKGVAKIEKDLADAITAQQATLKAASLSLSGNFETAAKFAGDLSKGAEDAAASLVALGMVAKELKLQLDPGGKVSSEMVTKRIREQKNKTAEQKAVAKTAEKDAADKAYKEANGLE